MSAATNAREGRLVSLVFFRGVILLGMIVVNIAAYIYYFCHPVAKVVVGQFR